MPSDRKRGSNVHKYGKFHLNIRRHFFTVIEAKHFRNRLPSETVESPSLKTAQSLGQPAVVDPALRSGGTRYLQSSFQSQLLCDSIMWKLRIFHFQDYHREHQHWIFIVVEPTENSSRIRKHSVGIPVKILPLRNFVNSTALVVWYFMKLASCLILYFHIFLVNAKLSLSWTLLFRFSFNNSLQTWYKAHIVKAHI